MPVLLVQCLTSAWLHEDHSAKALPAYLLRESKDVTGDSAASGQRLPLPHLDLPYLPQHSPHFSEHYQMNGTPACSCKSEAVCIKASLAWHSLAWGCVEAPEMKQSMVSPWTPFLIQARLFLHPHLSVQCKLEFLSVQQRPCGQGRHSSWAETGFKEGAQGWPFLVHGMILKLLQNYIKHMKVVLMM